ncbi:hypothetical protein N8794_00085 [Candidatus Pelagibacter sp.]|nr:hypothetical protein [Candidatus Pelagibacter sp.]|tara:strand:+ start:188 stop:1510 length:1323 start_codon:yes stop_codon:yes gene_type:complete
MKKNLIPIIYLSISLTILIYVVYKSEFIWGGDRRYYYFTYYLTSFSLLIISFLSFFLNQKIKTYSLIFFVSVFFTSYSFELYLSTYNPNYSKSKIYEKYTGKKYDTRTLLEIYDDLKKLDKNTTMRVFPNLYIKKSNINFFPLSGKSYSKTIDCNENGYYSVYDSDRYGFNNLDKVWDQENTEYLLLGDSFVQGSCVNRPNDISSLLASLSKKNVINLGYGGNGPLLEYASLKEFYPKSVKNILWFYYEGNDVKNLQRELSNRFLRNYMENNNFSQNLKNKQKNVDEIITNIVNKEKNINMSLKKNFYSFVKLNKLRTMMNAFLPEKRRPPTQNDIGPEFKKILWLANEFSKQNLSDLYFVYLPTFKRYKKVDNNNKNYDKIKSIINELGIPFVDIHMLVFNEEINPLGLFPFEKEGHYNLDGYSKTAKAIHKFIQSSKK